MFRSARDGLLANFANGLDCRPLEFEPRTAKRHTSRPGTEALLACSGCPTFEKVGLFRWDGPLHDHDHSDGHKHPSRRTVIGSATALGLAVPLSGLSWAAAPRAAQEMAGAARAWLAQLDEQQHRNALLAWSSPQRESWHYVPRSRPGVALREMSEAQVAAAWDLLGTLLSARGLTQVRHALMLEAVLGQLTRNPRFRDHANYAVVIFGDPAGKDPWAWRFEGHHLSLTTVVAPEHGVAVTPVFFGANPATVPGDHAHAGFRLLGAEEDAAFGLVRSLEGDVRVQALLADRSLGNIVSGPGREASLQRFEGVPLSRLNDAQQAGIMHLLELYTGTMREEVAAAALASVRDAGLDKLHFAWAGSPAPGTPHYFRIHGPSALVEYDNTQNGANHVHSVWIDPHGMFGHDLLKAHYQGAH